MKKLMLTLAFTSVIAVTTLTSQIKTNHDLSCYGNVLDPASQIESTLYGILGGGVTVTLDEELEIGDAVFKDMQEKYTLKTSGKEFDKVNSILNKLIGQVAKFQNPTEHEHFGKYRYKYKIYMIETDEINAFTAGARIFVTTAMYKFCESDDELACIIGHEICHNELGHINEKLKKLEIARINLGIGIGDIANAVGSVLTAPFNQKNEGHCDLFGMDLANSAGYDACQNIKLWERMNEASEGKNIMDIFSSHPYSGDRSTCAKEHLKNNYKNNCN